MNTPQDNQFKNISRRVTKFRKNRFRDVEKSVGGQRKQHDFRYR